VATGIRSRRQTVGAGLRTKFNALKKEQVPWAYSVTKCAVEGAFMDVAAAFKNFFEGIKAGRKIGYPKFKSKKRSRASFYLANDKFTVGDHWIDVPKLGRVNMAEKVRFSGKFSRPASPKRLHGGLSRLP